MWPLLLLGGGLAAVAAVRSRSSASSARASTSSAAKGGPQPGLPLADVGEDFTGQMTDVPNVRIQVGPAHKRNVPAGTVKRTHAGEGAANQARVLAARARKKAGPGKPSAVGKRDFRSGRPAAAGGGSKPSTPGGGGVNYGKTAAQAGAAAAASAVGAPWAAPIAAWGAGKGYDEVSSWF